MGGAKDKLSEMMGGGDEDKVFGIAVADIPKGSPLMKSAKPPAGDAIKPPMKSSDKGGVEVISGKGSGGGKNSLHCINCHRYLCEPTLSIYAFY